VNITGLVDKDTGDAGGDVYFALYQLTFPLYCKEMPTDAVCNTDVLDNINQNVYKRSVVEADIRFGVYSGCDPQTNGSFVCHNASPQPTNCWWNVTCHGDEGLHTPDCYNVSFDELCERTQCACKALTDGALGKFQCPMCDRNASWHNQSAFWLQLEAMSNKLNGSWYSTRADGECPPGQRPGSYSHPNTKDERAAAFFDTHDRRERCYWREVGLLFVIFS
jgi:hypothetical protein